MGEALTAADRRAIEIAKQTGYRMRVIVEKGKLVLEPVVGKEDPDDLDFKSLRYKK